ncbi:hypothetical protein FY134_18225 [Agrobacterium fabrum]|uniref:hypothetical protein n=1 Tax=Agrobacterium fabrum TaxID=1176649 RepID=UPI0021D0666F|nr:hypothetical protein [Agrobacterium fabrum]UXT59635.1 hypothetical protein FY134_18225 [Agrobacterium fabrum]
MADTAVVHIGENSPQEVAYKLLRHIADCEKRSLTGGSANGFSPADREWILKTYAEAINAVTNPGYHL